MVGAIQGHIQVDKSSIRVTLTSLSKGNVPIFIK